jgi:hypothetical protein
MAKIPDQMLAAQVVEGLTPLLPRHLHIVP